MHRKCYATLCVRWDSPGHGGRTWARTEPGLFGLFVQLLLNHTRLPLFVMHNNAVDPIAVLYGSVVPFRHLHGPHDAFRLRRQHHAAARGHRHDLHRREHAGGHHPAGRHRGRDRLRREVPGKIPMRSQRKRTAGKAMPQD